MFYDLIIVTQSKGNLITLTQQCINTARADTENINVIVMETGPVHNYEHADKIIEYKDPFNYNRVLNEGLKHVKGDVYILANNDIIFQKGWSKIGELMRLNDFHSASALSSHLKMFERGNLVYQGYNVGYVLTGWCLFLDKYCLDKIGKLDETVSFWYSDDLYALQLKAAGIKHGLFTNCVVDHIASQTLLKQPKIIQRHYALGELHKFNERKRYYAQRERFNQNHPENLQK